MRYDIRHNPPTLSDARIEELQNFDALLSAFQAGRYEIQTNVGELSDVQIAGHADFDALMEQWQGYEVCTNLPELSELQIGAHADFDALMEQMQGYEIHTDTWQPSDAEIQSHQDFEALLKRVQPAEARPSMPVERNLPNKQATPTAKNRFYLWVAPLAAAAALVAFLMRTPELPSIEGGSFSPPAALALQQPLPQIQKPFATFTLSDNNTDTTLLYQTGSKISVPASAFVDKKGRPVKGKVDIQYREMHDHVDMFVAGVPQQADLAHPQQAAAAVQVQAFQNGEPIYLQPDKSLSIELLTTLPADMPTAELAVYAYSPNEQTWKYQKADKIEILNQPQPLPMDTLISDPRPLDPNSAEGKKALAQIEKQFPAPKAPIKPSDDVETFDLDYDTKEFPELKEYSGILWTTVDQSKSYQQAMLSREWTSMKIRRKDSDQSQYELSLTDGKENIVVDIQPVSSNAAERENLYNIRLRRHEVALKERAAKINQALAQWQGEKPKSRSEEGKKTIIHRFQATQLGLWACANPLKTSPADQSIELLDENGKPAQASALYVAIPSKRIYYSLPAGSTKIHYAPDMLLWAVDKDKHIHRLRPQLEEGNTAQLRLQYLPSSRKLQTEEDLRLYLADNGDNRAN